MLMFSTMLFLTTIASVDSLHAGQLQEQKAVMLEILEDTEDSEAVRLAAFETLAAIMSEESDGEEITLVLLNILGDTDDTDEIRMAAMYALDEMQAEKDDILPALLDILQNTEESDQLRLEVLDALSNINTLEDEIVTVFLDILKDTEDSDDIRREAIKALNAAGPEALEKLADDSTAVEILLGMVGPDSEPTLRVAAAEALNTIDVSLPEWAKDWPMWRYDAERSAQTPLQLSEDLHLQWMRELPEPKRAWRHQWDDRGKHDFDISYTPVVMGDKIFVPSNVTDSVTAYSIDDGAELWRFYTDGPVRLAPAAWNDSVYFTSDDGHLYCVEAETGELEWKFQAGPSDQRLLGNERIINFWAARGGPVIGDGKVYLASGVWPLHGIFIYALDAETGDIEWINDRVSSGYHRLPHGGADGYGGLSPQGYLALSEDHLVVSGGRGPEAYFDPESGETIRIDPRAGHKGGGGYAVHADGRGKQRNDMLRDRVNALSGEIEGDVFYKLGAQDRLFVSTEDGRLYCFGPDEVESHTYDHAPEPLEPRTDEWAGIAEDLVDELEDPSGYALMLGSGSGDLLRELIIRTDLHIVVAEPDSDTVRNLRDELAEAGKSGRRAAVIEADPANFAVQPYLFNLVASEDAAAAGITADAAVLNPLLNKLRPYSGVAWLGGAEAELSSLMEAAETADVDQVSLEEHSDHLLATRGGPLSGAGEWTHQYHDAKNTNLSRDDLARLPLGVLWYGGPNNHNILPRHSGGPRPQVIGGRQVFLGVETIAARCVYTGRELWEREFPGIGHHATNLDLEERWERGHGVYMTNIPGATYIGSPFVSKSDGIYLRHEEKIHHLDPATGETIEEFSLPGRSIGEIYEGEDVDDWGTMRVVGDHLITTTEPHMFEDQRLGWMGSYSGTSSRRIAVLDRYDGEVLWEKEADVGFRHNAIIASDDTLYIIDGLSNNALERIKRRGEEPEDATRIYALELSDGEERWSTDSNVFGTFLLYSDEHDILLEGGSRDLRHRLGDEPTGSTAARRGETGELIWEGGGFTLPGAVRDEMLIPGRPGNARSLLTGETWQREQPHTGRTSSWNYGRRYGCNTLNASEHLLLYRSGYAGYFDLEYDSGTGNFSGFRSGCTANLIAADGVLNALDYTRTCTCSYALQTSLALVHMPEDSNIEFWTRYDGARRNPEGFGLNYGAPGRRVDVAGSGIVWHDQSGPKRRHPSAIEDNGGGLDWVAASFRELSGTIGINDLINTTYTMRLHFAELDESVELGERVFDVLIDGEEVLSSYDIVGEADGTLRGTVEEFTVEVEDGSLEVEFRRGDDSEHDPVISGIELIAEDL